jgi:hypothetical protein
MKLRIVLFAALLGLCSAAFADSTPAPAGTPPAGPHGMCAKSPDQCTQLATKFDQWCTANADKCTEAKAMMEKRREFCEANKAKCQAMREKMKARRQGDQSGQDSDDDTSSPPA